MDNHPIPQDVTNFQFRLIGDMTLKQFGYVAAGVIFAWIALASPLPFLLRLMLAAGSVMVGVFFAFVPVEGRPSDVMVLHFIKALFNPTQFLYQKAQMPQLQTIKTTTPPPPPLKEEKKEEKQEVVKLQSTTSIATQAVLESQKQEEKPTLPPEPATPAPKPVEAEHKEAELQQKVVELTQELTQAKAAENQNTEGTVAASAAHEKVHDLEDELQTIMQQKQDLEKQLLSLQKALNEKKQQVFTPTTASLPQETQHVRKIPKQMSNGVGAPLVPDVPNLVTGVIKDPRGNVLSNILIEVKDKDGNPVRAFKTNPLGQFASATPLLNGTYTIAFEDPAGKQSFDSVEITTNGEILMPLEIISVDAREKLRQELFG